MADVIELTPHAQAQAIYAATELIAPTGNPALMIDGVIDLTTLIGHPDEDLQGRLYNMRRSNFSGEVQQNALRVGSRIVMGVAMERDFYAPDPNLLSVYMQGIKANSDTGGSLGVAGLANAELLETVHLLLHIDRPDIARKLMDYARAANVGKGLIRMHLAAEYGGFVLENATRRTGRRVGKLFAGYQKS